MLRYFWHKYWRLKYKIKYNIPFFDSKIDDSKLVNPIKYLNGMESIAIIGKGSSIFDSSPRDVIEKCDFKVLLGRVELDKLSDYIGSKVDAQIVTHVAAVDTLIPCLEEEEILKYGVDLLIFNGSLEEKNRFERFYSFFHEKYKKISYIPSSSELEFDTDLTQYGGSGLTIASSILRVLYNVKSVKKIYFAGVDAFHYGYTYDSDENRDKKVFPDLDEGGYSNPLESHGKPFLKFLFDTVQKRNQISELEVYFPRILKKYIDFPEHKSFKFY